MFNRNLDVLRALAVLCVVADHCVEIGQSELPSARLLGRFGVLIFFVHTALVLLLSLQRYGESRLPASALARNAPTLLAKSDQAPLVNTILPHFGSVIAWRLTQAKSAIPGNVVLTRVYKSASR
jgi:hypothetical protein